jgi:hypothetical protein
MKKFNRILMAVLFMSTTLMTSCIDDTVAPEVTALRQAQVDLLTAKAALQALQTDAQRIANELAEAMNAIDIQEATSNLEVTLAENAAAVVEAQTLLEENQLALQQAVDDLAEYLAEHGLDEAADYLADYSDEMDNYYGVLYDISDQEAYIAGLELLMGADDPNGGPDDITFALAAEILQRNLDSENAELAGLELVLTALEGVQADPTSVDAALTAAYVAVETLSNANAQLTVDIAQHEYDFVIPAYNAYFRVVGGGSWNGEINYDGVIPTYEDAADEVISIQEDIDEEEAENVVLQAEIDARTPFETELLDDLTTAEALYTSTAAAYEAAMVARADAGRNRDAIWNDVMNAVESVYPSDGITNTWLDLNEDEADATIDLAAADAARDAAELALIPALAAYDDVATGYIVLDVAYGDALIAEGDAAIDLGVAEIAYDADPTALTLTDLNAARTALATAEAASDDALAARDLLQDNLDDADDAVTDTRNDYDNAEFNFDLAEANLDNHIASNPDVDFAAIVTASQEAWNLWYASLEVYSDAQDAETVAGVLMASAEDVVDNIYDMLYDFSGVSSRIDRKEERIAENLVDIAEYLLDQADEQAIVDALETEYLTLDDDAVVALYEVYEDAQDANDDMSDIEDANNELIEAEETLIDVLEDNLDNINQEIETVRDDIEDLRISVEQTTRALDDNVIDETEFLAEIAAEQEYLAMLIGERDGYLALADAYLVLFNAAIGG